MRIVLGCVLAVMVWQGGSQETQKPAEEKNATESKAAADAAKLPTPPVAQLTLKAAKDYRYMGKGKVQIYDLRDITMGRAQYGIDTRLPGMKYAVIARPPVVGGKLEGAPQRA